MTLFARLLHLLFGAKNRLGPMDQLEQEGHDRLVSDLGRLRVRR